MKTTIIIKDEYITLGQFLKLTNIVSSGGQIKTFLLTNKVLVNDIKENRRGRKLKINDTININNQLFVIKNN